MTNKSLATDDYVLGTGDAELERLEVQHHVWRRHVLESWDRAGIGIGDRVIDLGSGPGFAALDLARLVGRDGVVTAIERSPRFASHLKVEAARLGLGNIAAIEADVLDAPLGNEDVDAVWIRWLLCFLAAPSALLGKVAAALRPGGVLVVHEYAAYQGWQLLPRSAAAQRFVELVMRSWRDQGGEPNIALELPAVLQGIGMRVECRPIVEYCDRRGRAWHWLAGFMRGNLGRLCELGYLDQGEAATLEADLAADLARPDASMIGPTVLEIIARK